MAIFLIIILTILTSDNSSSIKRDIAENGRFKKQNDLKIGEFVEKTKKWFAGKQAKQLSMEACNDLIC